ncbi:MAG: tyrosine-type recombinase/integrase [Gammaproteobacteria bacterium]|nr:tyrosine-type recombinase/integrase [Gammaproteobacteria bacterium]
MQKKISDPLIKKLKPKPKPYEVRDTGLKGFILRVQPSGSMSYYCEYRRGKRERLGFVSKMTLGRARQLVIDIHAEEEKNGYIPKKKRGDTSINTLIEFLDKEYKPWFKSTRKPPYRNLDNLAAFRFLHDKDMTDISIRLIERWSAKQKDEGKADSTIKRYLNTLKAVLNKAVEWGVIEKSPLVGLKPIKTDDLGRIRFLNAEEEKSLFEALNYRESLMRKKNDLLADLNLVAYTDYLKPMVILAKNTGMRKGEILSLTWKDINFQTAQVTIRGETAKSSKTRHIPLNKAAYTMLKKWYKQSVNERVFNIGSIQGVWNKLIESSGISDFRFHDLRHDFASKLVMAGVDLKTVQELLGHADLTMTLRYSHLASSHKADAVEKLKGIEYET